MDLDETTLAAIAVYGGGALVLAALWGLSRWSHNRHIARYGPPPPGSGIKTFGLFVSWCIALTALLYFWTWGPLVVLGGAFVLPQLGFDNRAWGPWQRLRDAGIYAFVLFVPIAFLVFAAQSN
jgi:hypothetical protein